MVVELLSVFFCATHLTYIARGLGKLGYQIGNRAPGADHVLPALESLTKRGFLKHEDGYTVTAEIVNLATLAAVKSGRFERMAEVVRELRPARAKVNSSISSWPLAVRESRIELYGKQWDALRRLTHATGRTVFYNALRPFEKTMIADLPSDLRGSALAGIVEFSTACLDPAEEALAMLEAEPKLNNSEHRVLVEHLILRGRLDEAERRTSSHPSLESDVAGAFISLLRGRTAEAIVRYQAALKVYRNMASKKAFFPDRTGLFYIVALIAEGTPASWTCVTELTGAANKSKCAFAESYALLDEVVGVLSGRIDLDEVLFITSSSNKQPRDLIEILIQAMAAVWVKAKLPDQVRTELEQRRDLATVAGLHWYAGQASAILSRCSGDKTSKLPKFDGICLATLVSPRERWNEMLQALVELAASKKPKLLSSIPSSEKNSRRLAWIVTEQPYGLVVEPREQTSTNGTWSKGKPVALKRLSQDAKKLKFLTDADRAASAAIERYTTYEYYGRYPKDNYTLNAGRALRALAGNDNVFIEVSDGSFAPCEIHQGEPRLEVVKKGQLLSLALVPRPRDDEQTLAVSRKGNHSVEVVEFTPIHHSIARVLGRKPLEVPRNGESQLRATLTALSGRVAVQSDISGDADEAASVRGDTSPYFLLRRIGDGISVAAHVRPLGPQGPLARPGGGGVHLLAHVSGHHARATRELKEEATRFERAMTACPLLSSYGSNDVDFVIPTRDSAIEAILELRALADEVVVEWPDGEALQVSDAIGMAQLRMDIKSDAGSFVMHGALAIPDQKDLDLAQLIDYLSASPGRFLRLAHEERYLALSSELREKLDELLALSDRVKRGLRIHPLAASLVADLLASSEVEADQGWQRQVECLTETGIQTEIPSTLRAELRPYQIDGFRWLVRLSHWGAGGCLADDMGLGKTVQVIALLLHRAKDGPSLVVAPTSVVNTWVDEVKRFAPTLRVRIFAGAERANEIENLNSFDLIVTSYSILQLDVDALAKIEFATAVLDEAQVIKNAETKRARAAGRLRAKLRITTTGTPIENRLGDLHSLFSFLNPGLLGSKKCFEDGLARLIERDHNPIARDRLRRLIAPFVLRRTKTQVLPELPARTEVTLRVPLELEELAVYELIRERAIADLAHGAKGSGGGTPGRIQLLAAIMRLRRAASNARLVLPDTKAKSAKLAALADLLDDLLPNQHKVLIFSQFVDHLALVKEMLNERGVSYQYLDGSTPMAARKTAVDAFQAGIGEVFLISLKAGGFGLNLTAADYVVHMDPWWNPAVEDQASDRAHRIGQSRPVTIYRIVARDTIEDMILGLHHRKRELAAGILEGSDLSGKISEKDLLALIRGSQDVSINGPVLGPVLNDYQGQAAARPASAK